MFLYLSVIVIAMIILLLFNSLVATSIFGTGAWHMIEAVFNSFLFVIILNFVLPVVVLLLPKKWFGVNNKLFSVSNGERKFYEKIHIRKWKDKVWELGGMAGGFSKSKVADPHSKEYMQTFIVESHKGILDHLLRIVFGFFDIILYPRYVWTVGVPVALVNVFLNSMSTMVLRYNLPKLKIAYARLSKIQQTSSEIDATK